MDYKKMVEEYKKITRVSQKVLKSGNVVKGEIRYEPQIGRFVIESSGFGFEGKVYLNEEMVRDLKDYLMALFPDKRGHNK